MLLLLFLCCCRFFVVVIVVFIVAAAVAAAVADGTGNDDDDAFDVFVVVFATDVIRVVDVFAVNVFYLVLNDIVIITCSDVFCFFFHFHLCS